jgi:uncharacterized membrane protein (UPF0127 family)
MKPERLFAVAMLACLEGGVAASTASPNSKTVLPIDTIVVDADRGPVRFSAEIAADQASQEKGLMYRTRLAPDAGMLFDFHAPEFQTFWMKNTVLPLDMIFIRADGTISSIAPDAVPYSETPIPSAEPVRAVLEINAGRAAALGIEPGQRVHCAIFGNALPGRQ